MSNSMSEIPDQESQIPDSRSEISNLKSEISEGVSRRELIKLAAAAAIVPPQRRPAVQRFFTPAERSMVDELSEMIIPADDHSPGARAANVADYIDQRLAESWEAAHRLTWREGLKSIDRLSAELNGKSFLKSSAEQRLALLKRIAQNEANPQKPEEKFFVELKGRVAHAYYTSKIGIHDELEYKGNSYLRVFAGEEVS
jgi:hypothetical protein